MAHLLAQAQKRKLRRLIVILPFTNIITQSVKVYRDAIVLVTAALVERRNLFFDLGNEHDIGDSRFVSQTEVDQLVVAIHAVDPARLLTASIGGNDAAEPAPATQTRAAEINHLEMLIYPSLQLLRASRVYRFASVPSTSPIICAASAARSFAVWSSRPARR